MWRRKIGKIPFFIQKTSRTAKRKAGSGLKFMFCEISLNISWWPFLGIAKDTYIHLHFQSWPLCWWNVHGGV